MRKKPMLFAYAFCLGKMHIAQLAMKLAIQWDWAFYAFRAFIAL